MKNLNIKNSKLNLLVALAVAVFSMIFALLFTNTAYADCDSISPEDIESWEVLKDPITVQVPVTYRQEDVIALGNNLQLPVNASPVGYYNPDTPKDVDILA